MEILTQTALPFAAIGYSIVYLLAGGGVFGPSSSSSSQRCSEGDVSLRRRVASFLSFRPLQASAPMPDVDASP